MRELSLFTGAGGGLLGTRLMRWRCMGAVEIDRFCCERVAQRRDEGHLGEWFPVWNMDIADFNRRVAPSYRGMVDLVSAGFPCQPFSVAGKQLGEDDPRNMWPATIECIRVVRPRFCFLENVRGLLTGAHGYFGRILGDLAESGFDVRWRVLSAAEVGAPHLGDRVWVLASAAGERLQKNGIQRCIPYEAIQQTRIQSAPGSRVDSRIWPKTDTGVFGVGNGMADRLERVRAIGNGQVPSVAATAWELLSE